MSDTGALYEPLIERELAAIQAAARAFAAQHSEEELWIAVTRFAVLAYAPSQHAKRAVMACRAAHEVREELGDRWIDMIVECARYASESRQPWSEPPILDMPNVEDAQPRDVDELRAAIAAKDRFRAERWLAARIEDAHDDLRSVAKGDALLMLDTAIALESLLGEKGRFALLRIVISELLLDPEDVTAPPEVLIDRAIAAQGSVETVRDVFIAVIPSVERESWAGGAQSTSASPHPPGSLAHARDDSALSPYPLEREDNALSPYPLARDYAQTLIAHAIARTLPARADEFLAAVHHNLEHGESFAEWSFA